VSSSASSVGQLAGNLAVGLTLDQVLAAVPVGFAGAQADEDLEAAVLEIPLEGNQGAGSAFFDLAEKTVNLGLVEKKFTGPVGFRVGAVAVAVGGDVEGVKPGFAVFNAAVGVGEVTIAGADGLNFRAGQDNTSLDRIQD
jgi:hypothetical protein